MHKQVQHITTKLFYFKITDISFFIDFKFHIFNILGILFQRKRKCCLFPFPREVFRSAAYLIVSHKPKMPS
ncbi:TPA: hypothetical protein ACFK3U_03460 [Neisseria gonorrhoeae]